MSHLLLVFLTLPFFSAALKYSTRVVRTKYGPLRGVIVQHPPVEVFLGVPYATPPLGALRYMPPVTPSMWRAPRLADSFSPVCPQRPPAVGNRSEALLEFPRGRLDHLERLLPLLANQSEDCLYLNVYVPRSGSTNERHQSSGPLSTLLFIHGESFEWNSGNPYDGGVLASYGHVIVVTINYRLGILGFLKTGTRGSAQGNFGLMDLIAGLHWLRENLPAFGGDPDSITVLGQGTGAALANYIAVSPVAKELLHRVVLLSGSGLSPWALQREPLAVKRKVAEQTGCHGDLVEDDLAPCLRTKPLQELLEVRLEPPRFLPGFAPFVDGAVITAASTAGGALSDIGDRDKRANGFELADFADRQLLMGLTTTESYLDLSAQDLEFGFNETRRDRILRTFVRNAYYFHLNEIFSTLKNEYTDWERPVQNPLNVRDATLEVLSDGHTVAPLIRVGHLHTVAGGKTYFMHFGHHSADKEFPQRAGSVRGEDVPYALGLPLVAGEPFFPRNYTADDAAVSKRLIHYISNFVRQGDPNGDSAAARHPDEETPFWDPYDTINQLYLELGKKTAVRNHYRGHKMSLWLNLIPQLHRPGLDELSMRHHHFQEEGAQYYDGSVRAQSLQRPVLPATTTTTTAAPPVTSGRPHATPPTSGGATTTECPPNATSGATLESRPSNGNNLLRKLATSHYQSYTTALTVTIAVGCFLLLLNVLIFAGIYHQRDRTAEKKKKRRDEAEVNSCSSSSGDAEAKQALAEAMGAHVHAHAHHITASSSHSLVELPLQEFKSSPPSARRATDCPPLYCDPPEVMVTSPSIPEPPPPPKSHCNQSGSGSSILRQTSCPQTPNTMKKRVQIQEISV